MPTKLKMQQKRRKDYPQKFAVKICCYYKYYLEVKLSGIII